MVGKATVSAVAIATALLLATSVHAVPLDCRQYLEAPRTLPFSAKRSMLPGDLVRLRDIGTTGDLEGSPPAISLSPDHKMLAFQVRRANPDTNSYCIGMFVMTLAPGARPQLVDIGDDPIRMTYDFRGKAGFPNGVMVSITPQWTPDGSAVLFRKRSGGVVQVWRAEADGSGSWPLTVGKDDVIDFSLPQDGSAIRFRTQPGLRLGRTVIEQEGRAGFRYDGRFSPMSADRPFVPAPVKEATWLQALSPAGHPVDGPSVSEPTIDSGTTQPLLGPGGERAWLNIDTTSFPPKITLQAQFRGRQRMTCGPTVCDRYIANPWWTPDGSLRFLKREGWGREMTAIYEWRRGREAPRRIFSSRDLLGSCRPIDNDLICLREGSVQARYISRIGLSTGKEERLFDPNPELSSIRLGKVERLHWKNHESLEIFGDLVLPTDYRVGSRYPLIIVQYESRGFLRGGTGDEYPIQLFANNGYAVLSFNRPPDIGLFGNVRSIADIERADLKDFADRRSVQSALEGGVSEVVRRGVADPKRVGITGLSDGASTTQFALINSSIFAAAAISSCCWDASLSWTVGPRAMEDFAAMGYPGVLTDTDRFWDRISLSKNADRIRTPILLQLADSEYLSALTAFTALRERNAPIDMFVFPDEHHIKWQPAHRAAIYRRSLEWFDFWLKDERPAGIAGENVARWAKYQSSLRRIPFSEK